MGLTRRNMFAVTYGDAAPYLGLFGKLFSLLGVPAFLVGRFLVLFFGHVITLRLGQVPFAGRLFALDRVFAGLGAPVLSAPFSQRVVRALPSHVSPAGGLVLRDRHLGFACGPLPGTSAFRPGFHARDDTFPLDGVTFDGGLDHFKGKSHRIYTSYGA